MNSLNAEGVLWVAALDLVPIEDRIEWVEKMLARVNEINRMRESMPRPFPTNSTPPVTVLR